MANIDDWAMEAADRILDLSDIEIVAKNWNKQATRERIAAIIWQHLPIEKLETITVLRCNVCGRLTMPKDGKTTCSCGGTFEQVEWTLTYD